LDLNRLVGFLAAPQPVVPSQFDLPMPTEIELIVKPIDGCENDAKSNGPFWGKHQAAPEIFERVGESSV
jgi:hypothetical protein